MNIPISQDNNKIIPVQEMKKQSVSFIAKEKSNVTTKKKENKKSNEITPSPIASLERTTQILSDQHVSPRILFGSHSLNRNFDKG